MTATGGDILYIEVTRMQGKGNLTLTGQLGDVMRESAQIAYSYVRAQAPELGIDPELFTNSDFHVHVPAGAIPKDGPSAGVAMVSAMTSLLTSRPVLHDVWDDGGNYPAWAGPPCGWSQNESAGSSSRRAHHCHPAQAQ